MNSVLHYIIDPKSEYECAILELAVGNVVHIKSTTFVSYAKIHLFHAYS